MDDVWTSDEAAGVPLEPPQQSHRPQERRGSDETLHFIERFTRVAADVVRYDVSVHDSHAFRRPRTAALGLASTSQLFEYARREGNYAMSNIPSAARSEDKAAAVEGRAAR